MNDDIPLSTEVGASGIPHIKRMWAAAMATRNGVAVDRVEETELDIQVLNSLGIGLHQIMEYLYSQAPEFDEFESWVTTTAGELKEISLQRLLAVVGKRRYPEPVNKWLSSIEDSEPVLTETDLLFWQANGYVVLKNAVSENELEAAEAAIWDYLQASPHEPESWYHAQQRHGIMVELIQHPALSACRNSKRIHKAFAQLWGTADLWVSADRCGFHPPQTPSCPFPGPDLHWDVNFNRSLVFGTQGILYLTDTPAEQGAFTLVPGFHKHLASWLSQLDPNAEPQQQDLHALGSKPIAGEAGDLVIWHQFLPHGSRPNLGAQPRIVQYINMHPSVSVSVPE